jgi:hypothetical protein
VIAHLHIGLDTTTWNFSLPSSSVSPLTATSMVVLRRVEPSKENGEPVAET